MTTTKGSFAVAHKRELIDRIRDALAASRSVREVTMFGGLAFMVNERMVVSVGGGGDLLVRSDPERAEELLKVKGARPAEMGAGRAMGGGWISVTEAAVATDEELDFWIGAALEYNAKGTGARRRKGRRKGSR